MSTKLGQNFLKDKIIIQKIIAAADLKPDDFVIEVGSGEGILTEELAKGAKKVVAIEIDDNLAQKLAKKFENTPNIEIINADILKINLQKIISKYKIPDTKYKIVANLPYYITSPIIRLFLETEMPPQEMILMVQKEVAERIVAKPGKMSILAVSVQYYATPEYLFTVPKEAFAPVPKVESAVIRILRDMEHETYDKEETKSFFRLVRAGFSAKRKTLVNNLANSLHLDKKGIEQRLELLGFSKNARAQELGVADWKKLLALS